MILTIKIIKNNFITFPFLNDLILVLNFGHNPDHKKTKITNILATLLKQDKSCLQTTRQWRV